MKIFPGMHYSMGGAWIDWPAADDPDREQRFRHMTNLKGCFAAGECEYQYHGANRLGANSLLSCIYGGLVSGVEMHRYINTRGECKISDSIYKAALDKEEDLKKDILSRSGKENVHELHTELANIMINDVTVQRNNKDLTAAISSIKEIKERFKKITLSDHSKFANQTYTFAAQFRPMLEIALVITKGALLRDEFRGAHYKPEFPERDDEKLAKRNCSEV